MKNEILGRIQECVDAIGLEYVDGRLKLPISSLEFISFVSEIENAFTIEIPDGYLNVETFSSLSILQDMVHELLNAGNE